jgi:photosystem II stability/assembly factor-like uncharacterized protein
MSSLLKRSLLVFAMLCGFIGNVSAQWTNVAPNLFSAANYWGAVQFHAGVIWAGTNTLWSSLDSGKTWQQNPAFPNVFISDIAFYDKLHGVIGTEAAGIFTTTDGGLSWLQTKDTNIVKVGFNASGTIMYALNDDGFFYYSKNGGVNWLYYSGVNNLQNVNSFGIANDGTLYANGSLQNTNGATAASNSAGLLWSNRSGSFNGDAWTMSVDSCNTQLLYIASENWEAPSGTNSNFYVSTDGGLSWQITDSHATPYLSGSMATTTDGIVTGTRDGSGVHRSMDRGLTWKALGGGIVIGPDTRNLTAVNDNILVAIDTAGNVWLTNNGGGDSVALQTGGTLTPTIASLFTTDTVLCDSIVRTIPFVPNGCPVPKLLSATLAGADSASYAIESVGNDSITVVLLTGAPGAHQAQIVAHLDNGKDTTISLGGFISPYVGTFALSTPSLFTNDTIACDSLTLPVTYSFTGCRPAPLQSIAITGPDSNSFYIVDSANGSLSVRWYSSKPGPQHATLQFQTADGVVHTVLLGGFSETTPTTYSKPPAQLFDTDTLYLGCETDTGTEFILHIASCFLPHIVSESITGANAGDYTIQQSAGAINTAIDTVDTVRLSFQPSGAGVRAANYLLTLTDGHQISIPLSGAGYITHTLSLTGDGLTRLIDTSGATDSIPITIGNLARAETIELDLHYPTADLDYKGSVDALGNSVDIPGTTTNGFSKLRILNAQPGEVNAYARFNVFSDTDYSPIVTFDNLQVPTAINPCAYSLPPEISDTIVPLQACGTMIISDLIHLNELPSFSIRPNPSENGAFELTPSASCGSSTVEIYDVLGMKRQSFQLTFSGNEPVLLSPSLESGVYTIRIHSLGRGISIPFAVVR